MLHIILILPLTLSIQLIDDLFAARQDLQGATLIVVISRLWHQEVGCYRARYHKCAHDLQHFAEMFLFSIILRLRSIIIQKLIKKFCDEDLDKP
jgi:hypothetical protein